MREPRLRGRRSCKKFSFEIHSRKTKCCQPSELIRIRGRQMLFATWLEELGKKGLLHPQQGTHPSAQAEDEC
jgi:hypothetical protein